MTGACYRGEGLTPTRERGVALAIVVWFIAGMSLLVSGIVSEARVDTRMAQLHYFRAQAAAAGDGAINLALAQQVGMKAAGSSGARRRQTWQVGRHQVAIRMIPAGLFVNISRADVNELELLFSLAGDALRGAPGDLAKAVVRYRDGSGPVRGHSFYSPEDLLRVPGIDRGVYDAVRGFIVTQELAAGTDGGARPLQQRLRSIYAAAQGRGDLLNGSVPLSAATVRVDAVVEIGDRRWLRRRWVTFDRPGYSDLPWRVVRSEAARPLVFKDRG